MYSLSSLLWKFLEDGIGHVALSEIWPAWSGSKVFCVAHWCMLKLDIQEERTSKLFFSRPSALSGLSLRVKPARFEHPSSVAEL